MHYLLIFILGGGLVALVAFLAEKGGTTMAILAANIPVLFLLNVFFIYKSGGVDGSLAYARGALMFLPIYIVYVVITMLLLPRIGIPGALIPGTVVFLIPGLSRRFKSKMFSSHSEKLEPTNIAPTAFSHNDPFQGPQLQG